MVLVLMMFLVVQTLLLQIIMQMQLQMTVIVSLFKPQMLLLFFFSEYAEGSSINKYLEIFNPTGETVDLSNYAYPSVSNAATTPGLQ